MARFEQPSDAVRPLLAYAHADFDRFSLLPGPEGGQVPYKKVLEWRVSIVPLTRVRKSLLPPGLKTIYIVHGSEEGLVRATFRRVIRVSALDDFVRNEPDIQVVGMGDYSHGDQRLLYVDGSGTRCNIPYRHLLDVRLERALALVDMIADPGRRLLGGVPEESFSIPQRYAKAFADGIDPILLR